MPPKSEFPSESSNTAPLARLLELIAPTNRGILASATQHHQIEAEVSRLEADNPTPLPARAGEQLDGDWLLLYTTSAELLGIDRVPLLHLGPIYQCIRIGGARVYNIAEVTSLPYCEGIVSVAAGFEAVSDRRLQVQFERTVFGLQRWVGYQTPAQFISRLETGDRLPAVDFSIQGRQGWIDLTYLDGQLRINRGNGGSLFILSRFPHGAAQPH